MADFVGGSAVFLNHGIGIVIVNRLEVLGFDAIPGDAGLFFGSGRYVADEVFDEDWVVVSFFGDVFLVGALE